MKIFKTTSVALLSSLRIGRRIHASEICNDRRQADGSREDAHKGGKRRQPLRVQSPVDELRAAFASREGLTNCKPSNLYSNGVVGDPESCIMADRLSIAGIAGGHAGGGR